MTKESKKGVVVKIKAIFTILAIIGVLGLFFSLASPYINPGQSKIVFAELLMGSIVSALIGLLGEDALENMLYRFKEET